MKVAMRALGVVALGVAIGSGLAAAADRTPAAVVERAPAEYPAWAIGSGVSTDVLLRLRILPDSTLGQVKVAPYTVKNDLLTRQMRAGFDSAAVHAVRRWTFRAATLSGNAVAVWLDVAVPFEDPGAAPDSARAVAPADSAVRVARVGPAVSAAASLDTLAHPVAAAPSDGVAAGHGAVAAGGAAIPPGVTMEARLPMAVESARAVWPPAASYAAQGQVDVLLRVDSLGLVREARVDHRRYTCRDTTLAAAIDSAAVVAAMRWRFERAKPGERPTPVSTSIPFRIPDPPAGQMVVVGCVRDSVTKSPRPLADILGADGKALGRADHTGWFVLKGTAAAEAKKLRASAFCYAGGFRAVKPWRKHGDELTLYAWKNICADRPGR
jgi:outer membrane biosynthesis protein TonB